MMRLTLFGVVPPAEPTGEHTWDIGAAVLRAGPGGSVILDLGPADGPAKVRLALGQAEAHRLVAGLRRVTQDGGEAVVMT
jgi:hypothetical protein